MTELNKLIVSRRNLKGALTRTLASIEKLMTTDAVDKQMVQSYVKKAEEQFHKVEAKHDELVEIITDEATYVQEEQWMADCEQTFLNTMVQARKITESDTLFKPSVPPPMTTSSPTPPILPDPEGAAPLPSNSSFSTQPVYQQASPVVTPAPSSTSHAPKMTRMKFPTFNGAIEDYERFKEFFQYCTQGLTEMESFFQLTESMVNQREKTMVKSCSSIERAWEVLDAKYGDQDRLVDSLLRDLDSLKPYEFKGKINIHAMNRFIQTLQTFECRAESVGLSGELNSKIMLSSIKQKMPEDHKMCFYQSIRDRGTKDSLSGLTAWLREQLLLIEKCRTTTDEPKTENSKVSRSLHAVKESASDKSTNKPKCPVHPESSTHFLNSCKQFRKMTLKEKHEMMKKHNICSRCGHNNCVAGKPPHNHAACQFIRPCSIKTCGDDSHFPSICPVIYGGENRIL